VLVSAEKLNFSLGKTLNRRLTSSIPLKTKKDGTICLHHDFFVPLFYSFPLFSSFFSFILTPFLSDFADKRTFEAEEASAYFK
jgi:hypothetical protein